MGSIPFVKASACGNDFILVEAAQVSANLHDFTRRICDRHAGVGADGVEWLLPDPQCDIRARLINADGSDAEISGNGTRCVAAWITSGDGKEVVRIRTDAGVKTCTMTGRNGSAYEFETMMGEPQVGDGFPIKLAFREVSGIPVSMGNPHYVLFMDEFMQGWQVEAAEIGRHHDFEHGTNVELVRVLDGNNIEVRFFERGAGETKSSGTGSCAAAVAAIASGKAQSPVHVHAEGGTQVVRWEGDVFLRGTAQLVCRGEFFV